MAIDLIKKENGYTKENIQTIKESVIKKLKEKKFSDAIIEKYVSGIPKNSDSSLFQWLMDGYEFNLMEEEDGGTEKAIETIVDQFVGQTTDQIRDEIWDARQALGIHLLDITSGMNGYPEPYEGQALYGFESWEALEAFQEEFGGEIETFYWKNGWSVCESRGTAWKPLKITSSDFGDDYQVFDKEDFDYELTQIPGLFEGEKKAKKKTKAAIEQFNKAAEGIDWTKEQLVTYCGEYYDHIPLRPLTWNHDLQTIAIGLRF